MNILIRKDDSHVQIRDNDNQKILFVCSFNATANPNYTDFSTIDIVDNNSVETFKLPFDNATIYYQLDQANPPVEHTGTLAEFVEVLNDNFFEDASAGILQELKKENWIYHELRSAPLNYVLQNFLDVSFAVVSGNVDVLINSTTVNYPINAFGNKILGAEYNKSNFGNQIVFNGSGDVLITYTKAE